MSLEFDGNCSLQCVDAAKILRREWKLLLPQHVSGDTEEMRVEKTSWKKSVVNFFGEKKHFRWV